MVAATLERGGARVLIKIDHSGARELKFHFVRLSPPFARERERERSGLHIAL